MLNKLDIPARWMRRLVWIGLGLLFLGLFIKLSWELREGPELTSLDHRILLSLSRLRTPTLNGPMVDLTALGSRTVLTLFSMIGILLLGLKRDFRSCLYLIVGNVGAGIATTALKHGFSRPRPSIIPPLVEVSGYSYPSGHSLAATSFYLLVMFLCWRYYLSWQSRALLLALASALICAIAFSRLYLGVHHPSDVLSGIFLGASWVCLLTALFSRPAPTNPWSADSG